MAFQPVPSTVLVQVRGTLLGQNMLNDFYYEYDGTLTQLRLDNLTDGIAASVLTNWVGVLTTAWTGREVYARDLENELGMQSTNTSIAGEHGTNTSAPLPALNTLAIARRSGYTGRSGRGRIFWQGLGENMVTDNAVLEGVAADMVEAVQGLDITAADLDMAGVIVRRVASGVPLEIATTYTIVEWLVTDLIVDTRRSRKPTGGS